MKKLALLFAGLLVLTCGAFAAGASAAKPIHSNVSGTDTDTDFCGTGQTVDIAWSGVENLWPGPNRSRPAR